MDLNMVGQLVAIILIVCWGVKRAGLQTRYIPLLALVLGGASAYYFSSGDAVNTLYGIFTGLATTLGYREIKSSLE